MNLHASNKRNLVEQISDAEKNLYDLKKKSQSTLVAATQEQTSSKNKDNGEIAVNIDEILADLKRDILNVFKKTTDQNHADFQTKQPIDMLCEIEVKIEDFIKEIGYIES